MKYIIDIEEKPLCVFDKDTKTYFPRLWRVKGFNSLVFDEEGLSRLEELTADYINEHYGELQNEAYQKGYEACMSENDFDSPCTSCEAYQRGLDDAWEAAKKMFSSMTDSDIEKAFPNEWNNGGFNALMNLRPQEAIAKLKAYEEQKALDEIKVGDELEHTVSGYTSKAIFLEKIKDDDEDWYKCLFWTGCGVTILSYPKSQFKRTGRHFNIDKILEEMRE